MGINNIKISFGQATQEFKNRNYIPLFLDIHNSNEKLTALTKEGYKIIITLHNLKIGKIPSKFGNNNPYTIDNIKLWLQLNNKTIQLLSTEFKSAKIFLRWKCNVCDENFTMDWDKVFHNRNCPYCRGYRVGVSNCLATKNPELASEWHPTKNGDLTPYDVTCGANRKAWWKCNICGHEWESIINDRNRGKGCLKCNQSKGENKIERYLIDINYIFEQQYRFKNCKDKNTLPFDFAIFNSNKLQCLIEYDGIQHYESTTIFGEESFNKTIEHDQIKNAYCKSNNILLYRIPYWELNNIDQILNNIIFNNSLDFAV